MCPLTIRLGVQGSVVSSTQKMDFMHFLGQILGQKEATWNTIFSIFEQGRQHVSKNEEARAEGVPPTFSPSPPLPPLSSSFPFLPLFPFPPSPSLRSRTP